MTSMPFLIIFKKLIFILFGGAYNALPVSALASLGRGNFTYSEFQIKGRSVDATSPVRARSRGSQKAS